jgi:hypothetical protein
MPLEQHLAEIVAQNCTTFNVVQVTMESNEKVPADSSQVGLRKKALAADSSQVIYEEQKSYAGKSISLRMALLPPFFPNITYRLIT